MRLDSGGKYFRVKLDLKPNSIHVQDVERKIFGQFDILTLYLFVVKNVEVIYLG